MDATAVRLLSSCPLRTLRRLQARHLVISASARTSARRPPSIPSTTGSTRAALNVSLSWRRDALLEHISGTSSTSSEGPWEAKTWGAAELLAAMRVLDDTLGMTAFEFADTLGGHPSIYTKPVAVMRENAEDLAEQLGKKAALQLIKELPGALARGAWPDSVDYLQTQLGWSTGDAQLFVLVEHGLFHASGIGGSSACLAGPMMQYMLQLCQEQLALDPTAVLLRHKELLRSDAQDNALRVPFIGHRNLAGRFSRKVYPGGGISGSGSGTSAKVSEINTSFMTDSDLEWVSRLGKMGVIKQEWTTFESKFLSSAEWESVVWAEHEYGRQRCKAKRVEEQVKDAIQKAGGRKPHRVPVAAAAAAATPPIAGAADAAATEPAAAAGRVMAAAAAATAVKVHEQAAAGVAGSDQEVAAAAVYCGAFTLVQNSGGRGEGVHDGLRPLHSSGPY